MGAYCPICLEDLTGRERASPNVCDHVFCLSCLQKWSKLGSFCPVDRKRYRKIIDLQTETALVVKPNKRRRQRALYDFTSSCEVCQKDDSADTMLLCDCCDLAYHSTCLSPPLDTIPAGQWFCPSCEDIDERLRSRSGVEKIKQQNKKLKYSENSSKSNHRTTSKIHSNSSEINSLHQSSEHQLSNTNDLKNKENNETNNSQVLKKAVKSQESRKSKKYVALRNSSPYIGSSNGFNGIKPSSSLNSLVKLEKQNFVQNLGFETSSSFQHSSTTSLSNIRNEVNDDVSETKNQNSNKSVDCSQTYNQNYPFKINTKVNNTNSFQYLSNSKSRLNNNIRNRTFHEVRKTNCSYQDQSNASISSEEKSQPEIYSAFDNSETNLSSDSFPKFRTGGVVLNFKVSTLPNAKSSDIKILKKQTSSSTNEKHTEYNPDHISKECFKTVQILSNSPAQNFQTKIKSVDHLKNCTLSNKKYKLANYSPSENLQSNECAKLLSVNEKSEINSSAISSNFCTDKIKVAVPETGKNNWRILNMGQILGHRNDRRKLIESCNDEEIIRERNGILCPTVQKYYNRLHSENDDFMNSYSSLKKRSQLLYSPETHQTIQKHPTFSEYKSIKSRIGKTHGFSSGSDNSTYLNTRSVATFPLLNHESPDLIECNSDVDFQDNSNYRNHNTDYSGMHLEKKKLLSLDSSDVLKQTCMSSKIFNNFNKETENDINFRKSASIWKSDIEPKVLLKKKYRNGSKSEDGCTGGIVKGTIFKPSTYIDHFKPTDSVETRSSKDQSQERQFTIFSKLEESKITLNKYSQLSKFSYICFNNNCSTVQKHCAIQNKREIIFPFEKNVFSSFPLQFLKSSTKVNDTKNINVHKLCSFDTTKRSRRERRKNSLLRELNKIHLRCRIPLGNACITNGSHL